MKHFKVRKSAVQRGINTLVTVALILSVMLCVFVVVQVLGQGYVNLFGFSMFRVVTGSMEPTIHTGALLVCRSVDMQSIQVGDIICFRAQESAIFGSMMTHRVMDIIQQTDGSVLFQTKGDANPVLDGYLVSQDNFVGNVIWYTGENHVLSSVFSFFTNKIGFLALIVFPCLLIAGIIMRDCVRSISLDMRRALKELEEEKKNTGSPVELTEKEREEMIERIRAELIEELMQSAENRTEEERSES